MGYFDMTKKKKKRKFPFLIILIFLIGLGILIYPLISRVYYSYQGNSEVASYQEGVKQLTDSETLERLNLGYAYNSSLLSNSTNSITDPYSDEEKDEGLAAYAQMLEVNEKIGVVNIPKISVSLPIYAGTSDSVLQKGAGHLEGTSLPIGGLNSHSVITAHRGLAENKLFTDLDKMEIGDLFYIESIVGNLAYEVTDIQVIEPTDFSALLIQEDKDIITLLTCTPYMINSHRLLVIGERIELIEDIEEDEVVTVDIPWWEQVLDLLGDYVWILAILALLLVIFILDGIISFFRRRSKNRIDSEDEGGPS